MKTFSTVLVFLIGSQLQAQNAPIALARAEATYNSLTSITAEFTQTLVNRMLGAPETTTGTLFLDKPGKFAMRFEYPEGDRLVADGEWLWIYTPSSVPGQVIRQPIPTGGTLTPNLFAQFVERTAERYEASYLGMETIGGVETDVIRLVPKGPAQFRSATISIAVDSGLMIRVLVREESGQDRTLELTNIRTNVEIPSEEISFDVPRGTRVITP